MAKVGLIPYTVQALMDSAKEVPPGVKMIEAPQLWPKGIRGNGIVVAVIDTGCDMDHPELQSVIIDGYNFTPDHNGDTKNYDDNNGHGTHVCGTIAAVENDEGVVGVSPNVQLLVLKVLTGKGSGQTDWIVKAIDYAVNWKGPNGEKVRIISMSLGGPSDDPELHESVINAIEKNVLVVCAAGNEGDGDERTDEFSYPGAYQEVVEVGSVSLEGKISPFSNSNDSVDLVGPGEKILSTYMNGQYAVLSGTSMATPHIAGAAALVLQEEEKQKGQALTEAELFQALIKRTVTLNFNRNLQGSGLVKLVSYGSKKDEAVTATGSKN